jgi:hypothetical protein
MGYYVSLIEFGETVFNVLVKIKKTPEIEA